MTTTTESTPPDTIWGVLQPGEQTTRAFSKELPADYTAILAKIPSLAQEPSVHIVEQSSLSITIKNDGTAPAPYMVLFPSRQLVGAALGAMDMYGFLKGVNLKRMGRK